MTRFGVLWDLDGTITDSFNCFYDGLIEFLDANGFAIRPDPESYRAAFFGKTMDTILNAIAPAPLAEDDLRRLSAAYTDLCAERARKPGAITMVPGVDRVISELRSNNVPQAIGSSSVLKMIQGELAGIGLFEYFDNIVSRALLPSKPAPDIFRVAAASLGLRAEACVVFEDSTMGVAAAKAAGARCIAIATSNPPEALAQADLVLESYDGLELGTIARLAGE